MSTKITFKSEAEEPTNKHKMCLYCDDTWPDQVEAFFSFLESQGFIITYKSFLKQFGETILDHSEARCRVYEEDAYHYEDMIKNGDTKAKKGGA